MKSLNAGQKLDALRHRSRLGTPIKTTCCESLHTRSVSKFLSCSPRQNAIIRRATADEISRRYSSFIDGTISRSCLGVTLDHCCFGLPPSFWYVALPMRALMTKYSLAGNSIFLKTKFVRSWFSTASNATGQLNQKMDSGSTRDLPFS